MTTADSWNRIRDKHRIESSTILREEGAENVEIISPANTVLAVGYKRIVYGDHGPYIELEPRHIVRSAWKCLFRKNEKAYYQECFPKDGSGVKLYVQMRDVKNLPNPPSGYWAVRNNRKDGYADYRVGMLYINPDHVHFAIQRGT